MYSYITYPLDHLFVTVHMLPLHYPDIIGTYWARRLLGRLFCQTYTGKGGGGGFVEPPPPKDFETANN